ncbi:response regulator transcription factor [Chitinophaga nivalis]|uniref:Helix-turn-helix transcriptional regulator n=1 Tax=Chitinophaga nivalis TaxID=2991709 RepID=A0ABT3IMM0_9BACT|nr:helix-turn-helix transcriptional regulator [Chitinophaga nivalis]MCW3465120.1 helix-turn-helix transcriptional regulator [Chitinophaga nivalis]MCW3485188.1 helix-turn-helix transcriptional regulator [Chitinophaga nivalis]
MMKNRPGHALLTKNRPDNITDNDLSGQHYLDVVKAFARLSYESIYIIDYSNMSFEYVSDNPLFLCGHTADEVMQLGYEFYFQHVPPQDLEMLSTINDAGFDFYAQLPEPEKKQYSISYDFQLVTKAGKQILVNHRLTPLFLTTEGKIWKSMCLVSLSSQQYPGNVRIFKQGSNDIWQLNLQTKKWSKNGKPVLTDRELEVLRMYAQGLSINQIAEKIFVVPDTVKYYRRKIFERLEVGSIADALAQAVNNRMM